MFLLFTTGTRRHTIFDRFPSVLFFFFFFSIFSEQLARRWTRMDTKNGTYWDILFAREFSFDLMNSWACTYYFVTINPYHTQTTSTQVLFFPAMKVNPHENTVRSRKCTTTTDLLVFA